ncbi:hypothetical protein WJU16_22150 [Chitinophaga pollutisoli]|uniref:Uncharacterized protein n=1 Tax=Chitinophaga pollutisoli TaxID=3133966 RepID=A0ABZ2YP86_9BACT
MLGDLNRLFAFYSSGDLMHNKRNIMLGDLQLRLQLKEADVIVAYEHGNVMLENQSITAVADVLNRNFNTVYRRFEHAVMQGASVKDLQRMSVSMSCTIFTCIINGAACMPKRSTWIRGSGMKISANREHTISLRHIANNIFPESG